LHCSKVPAQDIGRRSSSQEFQDLPDGAETTLTCKVSFQTDNEMRICDKFQSKIHKTEIMLFSGEQSIPETEYLVKAVYYTGCKQHGHQGPCCLQHTLVAKASPSEQH
ncbi:hypothetical protein ACFRVV_003123, partial [Shigella sonnei]